MKLYSNRITRTDINDLKMKSGLLTQQLKRGAQKRLENTEIGRNRQMVRLKVQSRSHLEGSRNEWHEVHRLLALLGSASF